jgi:hypothetical protein
VNELREQSDVGLAEFLSTRARNASDSRLALDAALGLTAAVAALIWRPRGWALASSAALCFLAFGVWGIADRELRERSMEEGAHAGVVLGALRSTRAIAAILGGLAAGALIIELLGLALGTWIS